MTIPKEILELSDSLSSLPGVGPKLSNRLALYLAINAKNLAKNLSENLNSVVNKVRACEKCGNAATDELCSVCKNASRDESIVFVVEDALDLYNIEATNEYKGLYHVLLGLLSPINGIGPDELNIDNLIKRVKTENIKEIILGLNPNVDGESTSMYLREEIKKNNPKIKITKLARGIPVGSDLEFVSQQTIIDSMRSRTSY